MWSNNLRYRGIGTHHPHKVNFSKSIDIVHKKKNTSYPLLNLRCCNSCLLYEFLKVAKIWTGIFHHVPSQAQPRKPGSPNMKQVGMVYWYMLYLDVCIEVCLFFNPIITFIRPLKEDRKKKSVKERWHVTKFLDQNQTYLAGVCLRRVNIQDAIYVYKTLIKYSSKFNFHWPFLMSSTNSQII